MQQQQAHITSRPNNREVKRKSEKIAFHFNSSNVSPDFLRNARCWPLRRLAAMCASMRPYAALRGSMRPYARLLGIEAELVCVCLEWKLSRSLYFWCIFQRPKAASWTHPRAQWNRFFRPRQLSKVCSTGAHCGGVRYRQSVQSVERGE